MAQNSVSSEEETKPPEEDDPADRTDAIAVDVNSRSLEVVAVTPVEFAESGLVVQTQKGEKKLINFAKIEAIGVAGVQGLGTKPIILVDLVLNWMSMTHEPLAVLRIRGDKFDPRHFVSESSSPLEAMRKFLVLLLENTEATPLPDVDSARGLPFATFPELGLYEGTVLLVDGRSADSFSWK